MIHVEPKLIRSWEMTEVGLFFGDNSIWSSWEHEPIVTATKRSAVLVDFKLNVECFVIN
ncbi:hypothetical protein GCM10011339_09400 [Echinicola rosea]|uniref:Uncharacterized protein n=1 Tax=Echinicola rosea TaxID=1807691 RepID=A0ABQ1UPN4_9BACT|nr:hypothetical protein GCM10011339_09400 [Echinicola rosea]